MDTMSTIMEQAINLENKDFVYQQAQENRGYGNDADAFAVARAEATFWRSYDALEALLVNAYGETYAQRILAARRRPGGITGLLEKIAALPVRV